MTVGSVMNEGEVSARLGLQGWPNAAEDLIVARNIILSTYTGAHIHMQHISSKNAVALIRRAKARKINVSAEALPHHMADLLSREERFTVLKNDKATVHAFMQKNIQS